MDWAPLQELRWDDDGLDEGAAGKSRLRLVAQTHNTHSPRQKVGTLAATMGSRVQAMDDQISLRQRTELPDTIVRL